MKTIISQVMFAALLILLSAALYILHYSLFNDSHHIFIYLLGDIVFVPIEVLFVSLILHKIIMAHEKKAVFEKLNMVIGTFLSEAGSEMLNRFSFADTNADNFKKYLINDKQWNRRKLSGLLTLLKKQEHSISIKKIDFVLLKDFLAGKRDFFVRLLENPVLLEHQPFTEILMATFHLTAELCGRKSFDGLPREDLDHLSNDINRVYKPLVSLWLKYMIYLSKNYPYLFSLAMRENPFSSKRSIVIGSN
ncbi:MAG: hypothetical protein PHZ27_04620 [Candidatus Omnitrophica bacterium]|nr:hypothetical protein [Candidatus Omnitrophota bacterium]